MQTAGSTTTTMIHLRHGIAWSRRRTWHWQDAAHVHRSPTIRGVHRIHSVGYLRWVERRWNRRRLAAYKLAHRPRARTLAAVGGIAHEQLWLCVHRGEGAWNANTGNGYYGGLQMTSGWGGVARPDLLSPYAQMALAERQYRASRYSISWLEGQWPNTSPPCLAYR